MVQSEPNLELLVEIFVETSGVENSSFIWVERTKACPFHPDEEI